MPIDRLLKLVADPPIAHFYESIPGFFWFEECYRRLLTTLPTDRVTNWVEIGSFQGRSTAWLGVEMQRRKMLLTTIHAVDSFEAWEGVPRGADLRMLFTAHITPIAELVRVWPMRSITAAEYFPDQSADVVFVDGAHDYESVSADISAWWPKLKVGGFMAGDDFMMRPVMQAVIEQFGPSGYILCHGWTTNPEPTYWPSWIARKA